MAAGGGEEAGRLRAELFRWRGSRRRYPEELRRMAGLYARTRRGAGGSYDTVAAELGVSSMTVWEWVNRPGGRGRDKPAFLPVEVVGEFPSAPGGESTEGPRRPVIVTAGGLRVENLSLEEIADLIRRLA